MAANLLTSYLMDRVTDLVACQMSLKESILTGRFFSLLKRFFLLSLRSAQCPAVAALNTAIFFLRTLVVRPYRHDSSDFIVRCF